MFLVLRNCVTLYSAASKHRLSCVTGRQPRWRYEMSPGANLGDVMKMLYMTVGRGSALYSPMEHRNMPGNNTIRIIRLSCRVQRN